MEEDDKIIEALLGEYVANQDRVERFRRQLTLAVTDSRELMARVHSVKSRTKSIESLKAKLVRKRERARASGEPFKVSAGNLLTTVNDLAGVRILHLHTRQIKEIDPRLRDVLAEESYQLLEGPMAKTWDDESRSFFEECGIEVTTSRTLYTSVHYVVGSASRTTVTAEIQVRTLMEEVWGEVDHQINYPNPVASLGCSEQIKVLARVTSSATRLVDSIFATYTDYMGREDQGSGARTGQS